MKTQILTISLVLFSSVFLFAQDKIYLKDNTVVEAKITRVSEAVIEYKKLSNLEGPTFEMATSKIHIIIYENGESQIFNNNSTNATNKSLDITRRNRVNLDVLAIGVNGPTSVAYERLSRNGGMGIEIPFNVFFNDGGIIGYTSGANFKFYVAKTGKGFYVGPTVGLGLFDWYSSYYGYSTDISATAGVKLGGQFTFGDLVGLNLGANGGVISNFDEIDYGYSFVLGVNFTF